MAIQPCMPRGNHRGPRSKAAKGLRARGQKLFRSQRHPARELFCQFDDRLSAVVQGVKGPGLQV